MIGYAWRRALALLPTLVGIVVASFLLVRLTPGSPFASERALDPQVRAALEARYGLDAPLWRQLLAYLGRLLHGDLGPSLKYPEYTVVDLLAHSLPHTLTLAAAALAIGLILGLGAALAAAASRWRWPDVALQVACGLLGSTPSFVLGPLLVLALSLRLRLLPPAGWGEGRHLVLPACTLGLLVAGQVAKLARAGLAEVLGSDFVLAARAKGLSPRQVLWRHALRPAAVPLVTYLAPTVGGLLVGSVAVETLFCVPGCGPYFVDAAQNRDYFLVMGVVLCEACALLACNLLADVACAALDPRLRAGDR